jgi:hypothetical protein
MRKAEAWLDLKEAKIPRFRGGGARVSDARTLPASAPATSSTVASI